MKKFKASILAVTLIILGIMLITALSVSLVSIKERKASMGEVKSGQALQNAQSGVELVMKEIVKDGHNTVDELKHCDSATGLITDSSTGYKVELFNDDTTPARIACDSNTPISEIASIKSIGTGSGTQRAIEAAVPVPSAP